VKRAVGEGRYSQTCDRGSLHEGRERVVHGVYPRWNEIKMDEVSSSIDCTWCVAWHRL